MIRVWDAVFNPIGNYIEVVTVSRQACNFNHKAWHRIVELFPQYASQLGGGGIVHQNTYHLQTHINPRNS